VCDVRKHRPNGRHWNDLAGKTKRWGTDLAIGANWPQFALCNKLRAGKRRISHPGPFAREGDITVERSLESRELFGILDKTVRFWNNKEIL
jgi:hypothetical protein